jgi:hypothetical protein
MRSQILSPDCEQNSRFSAIRHRDQDGRLVRRFAAELEIVAG